MTARPRDPGFTLLEVLAILLVVVIGLLSVIALVSYAMHKASLMQGASTGLATAESVALDPTPALDPAVAGDWSYTPYAMNTTGATQQSTARGYVNGFYVVRTETSRPEDVVAQGKDASGSPAVFVRSANVSVDVFESMGGKIVASYTTRILRQRGRP